MLKDINIVTWKAWNKSPLANLKLSTAPCLVSSTAWARACISTWIKNPEYSCQVWKMQIQSPGKKNWHKLHHHHFKCSQGSKNCKMNWKTWNEHPYHIYLTSSNGGASYNLSWGIAGGSRSSRSNLSVRSDIGDGTPWRKQKPLCMLHSEGINMRNIGVMWNTLQ